MKTELKTYDSVYAGVAALAARAALVRWDAECRLCRTECRDERESLESASDIAGYAVSAASDAHMAHIGENRALRDEHIKHGEQQLKRAIGHLSDAAACALR